jgi:hypothetical protein
MASSVIPRIILAVGMTSELVGVMLIIYFTWLPADHTRKSWRSTFRVASELPAFLIIIGIVSLATALVVDVLDVSLGTAVALSGVLILGAIFCLCAWCFGMEGRNVIRDQS